MLLRHILHPSSEKLLAELVVKEVSFTGQVHGDVARVEADAWLRRLLEHEGVGTRTKKDDACLAWIWDLLPPEVLQRSTKLRGNTTITLDCPIHPVCVCGRWNSVLKPASAPPFSEGISRLKDGCNGSSFAAGFVPEPAESGCLPNLAPRG